MERVGRRAVPGILLGAVVALAALTVTAFGGESGEARASAAPTGDPVAEAFGAVRAGDCLAVHDTGAGRWSEAVPRRVDCASGAAAVRVTAVGEEPADCPREPGRAFWSATRGTGTVALCLVRRFETGTCLLARHGEDGTLQAALLTRVDCAGDAALPAGYDTVLRVTGVHHDRQDLAEPRCEAPARAASAWYWYVAAETGGRALLCTTLERTTVPTR